MTERNRAPESPHEKAGRGRGSSERAETGRCREDSRRRILMAAIREFAENGYIRASTNAIVRDAGTSKGLLFHYFKSKKDLYFAALEYAVESMIDYFMQNLGNLPADPVDRFIRWAHLKLKALMEQPLIYKMTVGGITEAPEDIRSEARSRLDKIAQDVMPAFMSGIDFSRLRQGVDPQKALRYILTVFGSLSDSYLQAALRSPDQGLSSLPQAMVEIEEYAGFLKHGLYRKE